MTAFDPIAAAVAYAELDTVELVNIAYLDPGFLPEAKDLAVRELNKRGVLGEKEELIKTVRREMDFRAQAATQQQYENLGEMERFKQKTREVMLISGLWVFALIAPWQLPWKVTSVNWIVLLLFGFWLFYVVAAFRKYKNTGRRILFYIVVAPMALFGASMLFKMAK